MKLYHSIPLEEPQRGKDLLLQMNEAFVGCESLVQFAPLLADGLVFTYPVLLVIWYLAGIRAKTRELQYGALSVFTAAVGAALVNIAIQFFIDKQRPEGYIDNADLLIMDHLPTAPFPSDHAAVGFAVAFAVLLRAKKHGHTRLLRIGRLLLIGAVIMSLARVGVAIHRPTDVIAGAVVGCAIAYVVHHMLHTGLKGLFDRLINFQERCFSLVGLPTID